MTLTIKLFLFHERKHRLETGRITRAIPQLASQVYSPKQAAAQRACGQRIARAEPLPTPDANGVILMAAPGDERNTKVGAETDGTVVG